jgi:hypothetical protein
MNGWNKLLALLDAMFALPNKAASKVKKLQQGFDNRTQEHVIWIEYRVRVNNAQAPSPDPRLVKASRNRTMALMRELMAQAERPTSSA